MTDDEITTVTRLMQSANGRTFDGEIDLMRSILRDISYPHAKAAVIRLTEAPPARGIRPSDVKQEALRLQRMNRPRKRYDCDHCGGTGFKRTDDHTIGSQTYQRVTFCHVCHPLPRKRPH